MSFPIPSTLNNNSPSSTSIFLDICFAISSTLGLVIIGLTLAVIGDSRFLGRSANTKSGRHEARTIQNIQQNQNQQAQQQSQNQGSPSPESQNNLASPVEADYSPTDNLSIGSNNTYGSSENQQDYQNSQEWQNQQNLSLALNISLAHFLTHVISGVVLSCAFARVLYGQPLRTTVWGFAVIVGAPVGRLLLANKESSGTNKESDIVSDSATQKSMNLIRASLVGGATGLILCEIGKKVLLSILGWGAIGALLSPLLPWLSFLSGCFFGLAKLYKQLSPQSQSSTSSSGTAAAAELKGTAQFTPCIFMGVFLTLSGVNECAELMVDPGCYSSVGMLDGFLFSERQMGIGIGVGRPRFEQQNKGLQNTANMNNKFKLKDIPPDTQLPTFEHLSQTPIGYIIVIILFYLYLFLIAFKSQKLIASERKARVFARSWEKSPINAYSASGGQRQRRQTQQHFNVNQPGIIGPPQVGGGLNSNQTVINGTTITMGGGGSNSGPGQGQLIVGQNLGINHNQGANSVTAGEDQPYFRQGSLVLGQNPYAEDEDNQDYDQDHDEEDIDDNNSDQTSLLGPGNYANGSSSSRVTNGNGRNHHVTSRTAHQRSHHHASHAVGAQNDEDFNNDSEEEI